MTKILRRAAIFALPFIASCSGSGHFGGAAEPATPAPKPAASADAEKDLGETAPAGTAVGDDHADQPIQITGTYLSCATLAAPEGVGAAGEGRYGCRLGAHGFAKVPLEGLKPQPSWSFALPKGGDVAGQSVTLVNQAATSPWHVVYQLKTADAKSLRDLLSALTVMLSVSPAAITLDIWTFSKLMPEILDQGLVGGTGGAAFDPTIADGGNSPPQPLPSPAITTGTSTGVEPSGVPSIRFALKPAHQAFSLTAALTSATGVSGLTVGGGGAIAFRGFTTMPNGSTAIAWTTPMTVAFQFDGKSCSGSGLVGPDAMTLTPTCK